MDNKTFAIAANKLLHFNYNWTLKNIEFPAYDGVITKIAPAFFEVFEPHLRPHLFGKWSACYKTYGALGVFPAFYGELDGVNRTKVLKWINENFSHEDNTGLGKSLETL